jgi:leader peptidase (prepilin peptidase)/N-methyltransferase
MIYIFLFLLGAVLGSFYNVLIYRIPRGMSIVKPPSHCPSCKTPIKWYNNIPIISYILLRGKCPNCSAKISIRYPLVEAFGGFLAVLSYYKWGFSITALGLYAFFSLLLVLSLIDWDTFSLPEPLMLGGTVLGVITSVFREDFSLYESLLGILAGALPFLLIYLYYKKVRKFEGLGFGDVELMALIGSWTGIWGVISAVFLGSLFGLLYVLPIMIKHKSMNFAIPFGPFLALGCFVGVVFDGWRFFLTGF